MDPKIERQKPISKSLKSKKLAGTKDEPKDTSTSETKKQEANSSPPETENEPEKASEPSSTQETKQETEDESKKKDSPKKKFIVKGGLKGLKKKKGGYMCFKQFLLRLASYIKISIIRTFCNSNTFQRFPAARISQRCCINM